MSWTYSLYRFVSFTQKLPRYTINYFDLLRIVSERTRNLMSPDGSQLNRLKLSSQIHLICFSISMGRTEEMKNILSQPLLTQWITRWVDYIHRFHNIKWSRDRCICNGNRAEWSTISPVILLVIDKRKLKHTRFWDEEDGQRKWAVFPYNSSSHNHFYNA